MVRSFFGTALRKQTPRIQGEPTDVRSLAAKIGYRKLRIETLEDRQLLSVSPSGSPFQVNSYTTQAQSQAAVAVNSVGDFVVTWKSLNQDGSNDGIYAQRFNAAGAAQGSEFRVNTYTTNIQTFPSVAMDSAGDFVIAWHSYHDGAFRGVFAQRYSATGVPQGNEIQVNTYTTDMQSFPSVAMDASGNFIVAWDSYQDGSLKGIYAQRYNASGQPSGSEFRVNTYTTNHQSQPRVVMDADGDFIVAWASSTQDASGYGVYAKRFAADGTVVGSEFRVNTYTTGNQRLQSVAVSATGDFVLAWESGQQDAGAYGIYAQRFSGSGAALGSEFRVNTFTTANQREPEVAMDAAGNFVITWHSESQDGSFRGVYAQAYSSSGAALGSEFRVNTYTTNEQVIPAVAMDPAGDFVVVWQSYGQDGAQYGIFAQVYDESSDVSGPLATGVYSASSAGVPDAHAIAQDERQASSIPKLIVAFSENLATTGMESVNNFANWQLKRNGVDVSTQITGISFSRNATTNRYEALLSLASPLSDGVYELTARSTIEDVAGNRLSAAGAGMGDDFSRRFSISQPLVAGSEFRVNTYTTDSQTARGIASDAAGNFVVVWDSAVQDSGTFGIYAQRYSSTGALLGSEFRVNTYTTGTQQFPSLAMDSAGNFVVAWTSALQDSGGGVFAQRFDATGTPQGAEFRVNTYTTNLQTNQRIAFDSSGNFVVTWQSYGQDGSGYGVYAQRYNAAGTALGSEFRVNSYTFSFQHTPTVARAAGGDFVIAWQSLTQDGNGYGVYAQRYTASGIPLGTEFRVNSYTTGNQSGARVAMDADGDFVVAWESYRDGSQFGVYAQRYDASGAALGSEFRINTQTANSQSLASVGMDTDGEFVVSWNSDGQDGDLTGVYAQRFNAEGVPQGSEFQVNTTIANSQSLSFLAIDSDGDFVIAWSSYLQDGGKWGVYAKRYSALASVTKVSRSFNDVTTLEPGERLLSPTPSNHTELRFDFSRNMFNSGTGDPLSGTRWTVTADGVPMTIDTTSADTNRTFVLLGLSANTPDGNYVVTGKGILDGDGRPLDGDGDGVPGGDFVRSFSIRQPATAGSEFRVNSYTTNAQGGYNLTTQAVAADASGDYVIVWTSTNQDGSAYGIYAQRYSAAGIAQGSEFRVNAYTTGLQMLGSVARASNGDFVVTWSDIGGLGSTHFGVYAQRYNAAGVPQGTEFRVNTYTTGPQMLSTVAVDADGDFVVTWSSLNQDGNNYGIYAQRYSALGTPLGSEFRVNTYTTSSQRNSAVAMDTNGDFAVVWHSYTQDGSNYGIYAQRFSASGAMLDSEFRVSTTTVSDQRFPSIAMDGVGDFVVAWSGIPDGNGYGVYAQRFNEAGVKQGSEFRINSYTTDNQAYPRVAMDADGDFIVTWSSLAQDLGGYGIYAQRFNAKGVAVGSEFLVNATTTDAQRYSAVAMDADGDFVVIWTSLNQDGSNYGVYARQYKGTPPLQPLAMTPTTTGFEMEFNRDFDPNVLNLYDQGGALGVADVTLTGASVGSVRGSVVVEPGSRKLKFIKSGGPLDPDTYTISLRSNATGFIDPSSNLLDGNVDGTSSDNYTAKFVIAPPPTGVTLAVGDFARGYSQPVNVPASSGTGLPITISNAVGIRSASFALVYDPALLSITGVTLGNGITGTASLDTTLVGIARITVTNGTQLSSVAGLQTLVHLTVSVPVTATYASKEILDISSAVLLDTNLAEIPAIDDDGIHIAAYFGDANGSQTYNSPDATLAQRIIVGTNTGLSAYQLADPYLIVDVTGNGAVQSNDVTLIQRAIVGTTTTQIPPHPGLSAVTAGGPDPLVFIPQDLTATVGGTITVPVQLLVTEPAGITLAGVDLAIAYDPTRLQLDAAQVGELLVGFGISVNTSTPGLVKLSLAGDAPLRLPFENGGILAELDFEVLAGSGATRVNLLHNSESLHTALYDDLGQSLLLQPAPTNADDDAIDGLIEILATDQAATLVA